VWEASRAVKTDGSLQEDVQSFVLVGGGIRVPSVIHKISEVAGRYVFLTRASSMRVCIQICI
jgi:hypothetical protein